MVNSPLVSPSELRDRGADLVLLDARAGAGARERYAAAHLVGAVFADLERDLARPADPAHGGRHPLPTAADFASQLGRWGIGPETDVVIYDDQSGANAASRAWWMLRSLGHSRVRVLDGGWPAAVAIGLPTTAEVPVVVDRGPYPSDGWRWPTIDVDEADRWRQAKLLIDARSPARFRGDEEPIDPIAGHIPGATNLFHASLIGGDGRFLPRDEIAARIRTVTGDRPVDEIAVHCGSGVTACHLILGMDHAGLGIPALYVGSWSEWCRSDRPREPYRTATGV